MDADSFSQPGEGDAAVKNNKNRRWTGLNELEADKKTC
jgi:hypothetical protein